MKKLIVAAAVLLIAACIAFAGCTGNGPAAKDGDTVSVFYSLMVDGEEVETNVGGDPIEFELGSGAMISGFDKAVHGMKVGDKTTVVLPPEEAYGEYSESNLQLFNLTEAIEVFGNVSVGDVLPLVNGYTGKVMFVYPDDGALALAVNHPMAGKTLTFTISLAAIK